MIKTKQSFNAQLKKLSTEMQYKVYGQPLPKAFPETHSVVKLDKSIYFLTDNDPDGELQTLIDCGDHYEVYFPFFGAYWRAGKSYNNKLAWILDEDTIMFVERPYTGRAYRYLKTLIPSLFSVDICGNDIIINGTKVAPTLNCGNVKLADWAEGKDRQSSMIYLFRWSNVERLDKYFAGDKNHELRKTKLKQPLSSLDKYVKISKEEFIKGLESLDENY